AIAGLRMYQRVMQMTSELEQRHIEPVRQKLDAILDDVRMVTASVSHQTERVDHAISGTIDRVDVTAERVRASLRMNVYRAIGIIRGIRAVIESLLVSEARHEPGASAPGRA